MSKLAYSCAYCAKRFSLKTLERGKAFVCPKCQQCQVIPTALALFPKKNGWLGWIFLGFLLTSGVTFLRYREEIPRLEKLQQEAEIETYYGNYTKAIEYYYLMKRESEIQEKKEQIPQIDSKIQELLELQKRKNLLEQKKTPPEKKKDFQNTQK